MKRKLIQNLLETDQLSEAILKLLPQQGEDEERARHVLTVALNIFRKAGGATSESVYAGLCGSSVAELAAFLKGSEAGKVTKQELAAGQAIWTPLLTNKAGRPRSTKLSRQEQNAAAQERRRQRLKDDGKSLISLWVEPKATEFIDSIKDAHGLKNQAEALEKILDAAMNGEVIKPSADR